MQTELFPKTRTLPKGIKGLVQRKQLFPRTFFGVSAIHEANIWNNFAYMKIFSGRINSREI